MAFRVWNSSSEDCADEIEIILMSKIRVKVDFIERFNVGVTYKLHCGSGMLLDGIFETDKLGEKT